MLTDSTNLVLLLPLHSFRCRKASMIQKQVTVSTSLGLLCSLQSFNSNTKCRCWVSAVVFRAATGPKIGFPWNVQNMSLGMFGGMPRKITKKCPRVPHQRSTKYQKMSEGICVTCFGYVSTLTAPTAGRRRSLRPPFFIYIPSVDFFRCLGV